jgi:two-component sensor histidine kinase
MLAAGEVVSDRGQVLSEARRNSLVMLDTIHGQAEKVFQFQTLALAASEDRLRGLSDEEIRADAPNHHAFLRRLKLYADGQLGIVIFGADGYVLVDSERPRPPVAINVARRDYFLWHRDNPGTEPFVSGPGRSQTNGEVVFFITRRRSAEDGSFLGVAAVIVRQSALLSYWDQAVPDRRGLVSLLLEDGTFLARRPALDPESMPRMLPQAPLFQAASIHAERRVIQGSSPHDKVERLAAYRRLEHYPVSVAYGIPVDAVLAPWRRRALAYGGFAVLTSIALSWLVLLARRRTLELSDLNATLEQRVRDRTAEIESGETRLRLLAREVDHRAKNALAVVQAMLQLTPKNDLTTYVRAVEGRVSALSRAQTLLSEDQWRGASLHALLKAELAPFVSEGDAEFGTRAELEGPPVLLPPTAAQPLAMAVHELATNAVKHGALSTPGGRVAISWHLTGQGNAPARALVLRWKESGGPPVAGAPAGRGFGSRVMTTVVRGQLGGRLSQSWLPGGLLCEIVIPMLNLRRQDEQGSSRAA